MSTERRAEFSRKQLEYLIDTISGSPQAILFEKADNLELDLMEARLGIKLPPSYRFFLSCCSDGCQLYQTEEFLGTKDDGSDNETRKSILTVKAQVSNLPAGLIPFHQNAAGLYCFDAQSATGEYPVVRWDSEKGRIVEVKKTFTDWLGDIVAEYD